jgi:hypothetical protein
MKSRLQKRNTKSITHKKNMNGGGWGRTKVHPVTDGAQAKEKTKGPFKSFKERFFPPKPQPPAEITRPVPVAAPAAVARGPLPPLPPLPSLPQRAATPSLPGRPLPPLQEARSQLSLGSFGSSEELIEEENEEEAYQPGTIVYEEGNNQEQGNSRKGTPQIKDVYAVPHVLRTHQPSPQLPVRQYKVPSRPDNVTTNPFNQQVYLEALNKAIQNSTNINNTVTKKELEKIKKDFEEELRQLNPPKTLYELPLADEITHSGGARKRTLKHNNKTRTQKTSKSKYLSRK